jgi:hypothetical protein
MFIFQFPLSAQNGNVTLVATPVGGRQNRRKAPVLIPGEEHFPPCHVRLAAEWRSFFSISRQITRWKSMRIVENGTIATLLIIRPN